MAKRKRSKEEKKKGILTLLLILGIAIVIAHLSEIEEDPALMECPRDAQGNAQASLHIKVFDSPYCLYCHIQEGSLKSLMEKYSDHVYLEHFDIRYCSQEAITYGVRGTPGFAFLVDGEFVKSTAGLIEYEHLENIVCETTDGC